MTSEYLQKAICSLKLVNIMELILLAKDRSPYNNNNNDNNNE